MSNGVEENLVLDIKEDDLMAIAEMISSSGEHICVAERAYMHMFVMIIGVALVAILGGTHCQPFLLSSL
jgi:hypothetical protein